MKNGWRWVIGIVVGLVIVGFLWAGRSSRQAYRIARGGIEQRVELAQDRIDAVEEMAIAAVDLALELSAELPSQQAKADLVKQDIQEISDRLNEAAELRGDEAIDRLDQSIEAFNNALNTVEDASSEAESPVVKSTLDRIYGTLLAVQEQLTQFLITGKQ